MSEGSSDVASLFSIDFHSTKVLVAFTVPEVSPFNVLHERSLDSSRTLPRVFSANSRDARI